LSAIVSFYKRESPALIIGPVAFQGEENVFERMQSLEFSGLQLVTGASAALGSPLMCSGANLAYPRTVFEEVKGYEGDEVASGDDVLLMKRIAQKHSGSIRFLKSVQAIVYTSPQKTFPAFLQQRKRWSSKFRKYGTGPIAGVAVLVFLCNLLFLAGGLVAIFTPAFGRVYLILAVAKLIIDFLILFLATSFTNRKKLLWVYLPELFFYSFYVVLIAWLGLQTQYSWKGRQNEQVRTSD
jgi:cellulose synthase/poly-beta-1,6-N-acetylglucosamine synthase-like glycosyltransferase